MKLSILLLLSVILVGPILFSDAFAQVGFGGSPFEREYQDVKYLDAFFGIADEKIEISPGDRNVPFTIIMANVGTQDITGIRGQLSLPLGFTPSDGTGSLILADSDTNAAAGDHFAVTFFVSIGEQLDIRQYPGSAKIDYSRLRESGVRNSFFDFNFKITGDSIINMRAVDPFLVSLQKQIVVIEISNDGTAPVSGVDIELQNTQGTISSTSQSVTNTENVVILDTNWDVGHLAPGVTKIITAEIYVPESLKGETLRTPMEITYFNAHGDRETVSRIVDFYVKGFIDAKIYDVSVIDLSGTPTVIGSIINEGNEDALFGFVTLKPVGNSNIKETKQYIDEIEIDSPVPFNIPIEFVGEPRYGEHDIDIIVRYKDDIREEKFITYSTTIFVQELSNGESDTPEMSQFIILAIAAGIGAVVFAKIRKKKKVST